MMKSSGGGGPPTPGYPQSPLLPPHRAQPSFPNHGMAGQASHLSALRPNEQAAAAEYDRFLNDLTFNSKDVINNLTKIAGENVPSFNAIAHVLENRILLMPPHAKLPFLYVVDSICKNIGAVYVNRFRQSILRCFVCAYECSAPPVRASMQRLLNTWPPVFGAEIVGAIRHHVAGIDAAPLNGRGGFPAANGVGGPNATADLAPGASGGGGGATGHAAGSTDPRSGAPAGVAFPPSPHASAMAQIGRLFAEVTRSVAAGAPPSALDLNSLSSLISGQMQSTALPPSDREELRALQSRLGALTARGFLPSRGLISSVNPNGGPAGPLRSSVPAGPNAQSARPAPAPSSSGPVAAPPLAVLRSALPAAAAGTPASLNFSQLKTLPHTDIIRSLYTDLGFLSKMDGMRFKNQLDLRGHLDWLFVQNKRKRARARATGGSGVSRCWYEPTSQFLGAAPDVRAGNAFGNANAVPSAAAPGGAVAPTLSESSGAKDKRQPSEVVMCEAMGGEEVCPTCCEGFQSSWDDDKQAWMLNNGIRPVQGGKAYHKGCCMPADADGLVEEDEGADGGRPGDDTKDGPAAADKSMATLGAAVEDKAALEAGGATEGASAVAEADDVTQGVTPDTGAGAGVKRHTHSAGAEDVDGEPAAKKTRLSAPPPTAGDAATAAADAS
jgi:pre-mRNA cleavage complex 2 protein Pcf11